MKIASYSFIHPKVYISTMARTCCIYGAPGNGNITYRRAGCLYLITSKDLTSVNRARGPQMENLEKERIALSKLDWILRIVLIGFVILVFFMLVRWAQADIGRSIHDGTWTIRYTDCQGNLTIYENATVTDSGDVWLTIVYDNGQSETKLPIRSVCAEIRMDRER